MYICVSLRFLLESLIFKISSQCVVLHRTPGLTAGPRAPLHTSIQFNHGGRQIYSCTRILYTIRIYEDPLKTHVFNFYLFLDSTSPRLLFHGSRDKPVTASLACRRFIQWAPQLRTLTLRRRRPSSTSGGHINPACLASARDA